MSAGRDTIFALSSAPGRAGVAVVRVSGPAAGAALEALTGQPLPAPRQAALKTLRTPGTDRVLDRGLVLWFPGPASFTGEDVAELHVHGGPAVIAAVTQALAALPDLRPAAPGEFTRRAVFAGKMDLTQAEGLIDLIHAETEAQRRQALAQADGALRDLYEDWRQSLIRILAYAEAEIDFPDEGDVPDGLFGAIRPELERVTQAIAGHLADGHRGERLRDGVSVVLLGAPNAGKSTLLNVLAKRDVAIVSEIAGTTRDALEVPLDLAGVPVTVTDTAGLRDSADTIEQEGVRRALGRARAADLRVYLSEAGEPPVLDAATRALMQPGDFGLLTKTDRLPSAPPVPEFGDLQPDRVFAISAKTGDGLDRFLGTLEEVVRDRFVATETPALTRARHRTALEDCHANLSRVLASAGSPAELIAEDLRRAIGALGSITGAVHVEDLLDVIFRDFCIGK